MTRRRAIELAVVVFGLAFLAYLAVSFRPGRRPGTGRNRPEAIPDAPAGAEAGQPTTVLKGFDYAETVRGKPVFRIQAKRTVGFGPAAGLLPNLYALENVTLTVYPESGAPVTVNAERATYDHRTSEAHLNGNVRWIDGHGALGETEEMEFQPGPRILIAPKPVRLTRGAFVLNARSGRYDIAHREARLAGPIRGTGTGEDTGGLSALSADRAIYRRDESTLELSGSVSGTSVDGSRIAADALVLKTGQDGQRLDWARAEGNVRGAISGASLPRTAPGAPPEGGPRPPETYAGDRAGLLFGPDGAMRSLSLSGSPASVDDPIRKLRASEIELSFEQGRARTATAKGSVKIETQGSRGEADQGAMILTPSGEVLSLELSGSVRLEGDGRTGRADKAVQAGGRNVWVLTAAPGRSASVAGDGSRVSAARIEIDQVRKGLRAEGAARAVLTPRQNGAKLASPVGDASRPTFAKADRMTFDDASHVATFSGSATLWQDASSVFGNDITVNDQEHTLVAVGNTRTVFSPASAEKSDKSDKPDKPEKSSAAGKVRGAAGGTPTPVAASDRRPSVITARQLIYREAPEDAASSSSPKESPPPASTDLPAGEAAGEKASASIARFDGSVTVMSAEWRATANQAIAWIGKDRKLDRVELTGDVVFQDSKEGRNGRAEHAVDYPRVGKTILEGKPAFVVDREGNRVAGATLTIAKRGGSVEVTAPEGGRTETIHKTHSP